MIRKQIKRAALAAGVTVACSGQASSPPDQEALVRAVVVREADAQISAWRPMVMAFSEQAVTLRSLRSGTPNLQIWEAWAPVDHWHRYVVGQKGNKLWLLAGFSGNDLPEFYNLLLAEGATPRAEDQLGPYLVELSDPNGGETIVPCQATGGDAITGLWVATRPAGWPADTTHVYPDGARLLRLTVLSKQENSYDQPYVPTVYTFRFDAQGHLQAWHRREGAVLRGSAEPPKRGVQTGACQDE